MAELPSFLAAPMIHFMSVPCLRAFGAMCKTSRFLHYARVNYMKAILKATNKFKQKHAELWIYKVELHILNKFLWYKLTLFDVFQDYAEQEHVNLFQIVFNLSTY